MAARQNSWVLYGIHGVTHGFVSRKSRFGKMRDVKITIPGMVRKNLSKSVVSGRKSITFRSKDAILQTPVARLDRIRDWNHREHQPQIRNLGGGKVFICAPELDILEKTIRGREPMVEINELEFQNLGSSSKIWTESKKCPNGFHSLNANHVFPNLLEYTAL